MVFGPSLTSAHLIFDMGSALSLDSLALWNEDSYRHRLHRVLCVYGRDLRFDFAAAGQFLRDGESLGRITARSSSISERMRRNSWKPW